MLERAGEDNTVIRSVFEILFPLTQGHLGGAWYGSSWETRWHRNGRVASGTVFRVYLQAGLDEGALSSREVRGVVDAMTDEKRLASLLDSYDEWRFEAVLERLDEFEDDVPIEALPIAVPALVNRAGRLSPDAPVMLGVSPRLKLSHIVRRLMRKLEHSESPSAVVRNALERVDSLSGRFRTIEIAAGEGAGEKGLIDENEARQLVIEVIEDLRAATAEELAGEWDLTELIVRTQNWIDAESTAELKTRLCEHLGSDFFVGNVLRTSINIAYLNGVPERRLFWDSLIETFGDELTEAVKRLALPDTYRFLSSADQEAVDLAQRYVNGWNPKGIHDE